MNFVLRLAASAAICLLSFGAVAQTAGERANRVLEQSGAEFDVYGRIETRTDLVTEDIGSGLWRAVAPISYFASGDNTIRLTGANARRTVAFGLSPRIDVVESELRIRHISSVGLVESTPHLRISLNEFAMAQTPALGQPSVQASAIRLDADYLRAGYNTLWFDGIHRYTYDCQDPTAAELWSEVDARGSELDIIYRRRAFSGRLSELRTIVQPGIGGVERLAVLTPGELPTGEHLLWGALGIQALVNRMDGVVPDIEHRGINAFASLPDDELQKSDIILVGTADEVRSIIGDAADDIREAHLELMPSPYDETAFMLIVSGETGEDVRRAAMALNRLDYPLADDRAMTITAGEMPAASVAAFARPVDSSATYRLRELGFSDTSVTQQTYGRFDAQFLAPADYFASEDDEIIFNLDLAYGANLRSDSALNVFLNGDFQKAIWLRESEGAVLPGYEVRVDARSVRPGSNTLGFEVTLTPSEGGECGLRSDKHLAFVLQNSSTVSFPDVSSYAELPDLGLLRDMGYPLVSRDAAPVSVRLLERNSETIAAAWSFVAKTNAVTLANPGSYDFDFGAEAPADAHVLFVGRSTAVAETPSISGAVGRTLDERDLGRTGVLSAFKSPFADDRLYLVLTASTAQQLESVAATVSQPSHWSQLGQGRTEWRTKSDTVASFPADETFSIGTLSDSERIAFLNSQQPMRWVFLLMAFLAAMAVLLAVVARYLRNDDG